MVVAWASEGLGQLAAGSSLWYRIVTKAQPDAVWQLGTLVAVGTDQVQVQTLGRKPHIETIPLKDAEPANPEALSASPDLTALTQLNEPSILHALQQRYEEDVIYTTAGPVLIAVNPCKPLPLYENPVIDEYRQVKSDLEAAVKKPHIFLNAGKAFRDMVDNNMSQSMVISGESGAGKTETTKKAMQFFAQMSGGHGIEDQVLQTNPLLEAFGNAKTLRNHNSSRFGKLLEIHFNQSNHICGAKIITYLLEKSRVVYQIPGERGFHIFYQMLRGATPQERLAWKLPQRLEDFRYLNGTGAVTSIEGIDDAADFRAVRAAMTAVHITPEQQHAIFSVVSAVLWLGNIAFTAKSDDAVRVEKDEAFTTCCELLAVPCSALEFALTHRLMTVGAETYERPLNLGNALDTRDALAKVLYASIFSYIVDCINQSLATEKRLSGKVIAILDIYGFESFAKNSFEQLCINYANERLQQQFNKHLFKLEQEEYECEGIDWSHIDFVDNQDCLDTIDAKPPKGLGVMSVLDDQCNFPKSTDQSFSDTIRERIRTPRFRYRPGPHKEFVIEHYAGPVTYDCSGFLDKNRDSISVDLVKALHTSSAPICAALLPYVQLSLEGKNKATVASRFRDQLLDLVARLDQTEMHFVRCIKPNFGLEPDTFDQLMILQQLRCCGVLEVVRIAKAGYPTRYEHKTFVKRYSELMPKGSLCGNAVQQCEALLGHFRVPETVWQLGHTKIFFKAGVLGAMEDLWRRTRGAVLVIQKNARMHAARTRFVAQRRASTTIARHRRGLVQRRAYAIAIREHRAAVKIQAGTRGLLVRREAARRLAAITTIQVACKRWHLERRCKRREADMRQALEFAQNRALRAQDKLHALESQLEEWAAIKEEFCMSAPEIRAVLKAWRTGAPEAAADSRALPAATLSEQDARDLKLLQQHRQAFFAWQMGAGLDGVPRSAEESELQVWRAHRAQFFKWKQEQDSGGSSRETASAAVSSSAMRALTLQLEEAQQKCANLVSENAKLRSGGQVVSSSRPGANGKAPHRKDATRQPIGALQHDYKLRTDIMDDDLSFIQEVVTGTATAIPDFNPEVELRKLKHSFDAWKETFKVRMKDTYAFVKRAHEYQASRAAIGRSSRGSYSSYQPPVHPSEHALSPQPQMTFNSAAMVSGQEHPGLSPRSSGSIQSPSENYVAKMREGMRGAAKKGSAMAKGMVDKFSRSMTRDQDPGRVSLTSQGTIDHRLHTNGGRYPDQ